MLFAHILGVYSTQVLIAPALKMDYRISLQNGELRAINSALNHHTKDQDKFIFPNENIKLITEEKTLCTIIGKDNKESSLFPCAGNAGDEVAVFLMTDASQRKVRFKNKTNGMCLTLQGDMQSDKTYKLEYEMCRAVDQNQEFIIYEDFEGDNPRRNNRPRRKKNSKKNKQKGSRGSAVFSKK